MAIDPIQTAISGLHASSTRLAVGANNIANAQSTGVGDNPAPYVPQQSQQHSQATGGVATSLRDISPPTIPVFSPEHPAANEDGILQTPNVSLADEANNRILATHSYKANMGVIKRANEMYQSLLDIKS